MNPTVQQIAIAKACGWFGIMQSPFMVPDVYVGYPPQGQMIGVRQEIARLPGRSQRHARGRKGSHR